VSSKFVAGRGRESYQIFNKNCREWEMEEAGQGELGAREKKNHEQEEDEEKESRILQAQARQLESAILSLLRDHHPDASKWITDFVTLPEAWSVSLYLAFPPPETTTAVGRVPEARFFALNLLLAKIRSDWSEVAAADAREIYEVLWRQLPANLGNPMVAERLCLVVSSAAAMAGAETCYELVESIVGGESSMRPSVEPVLGVELLISLAEESLLRSSALPWQVGECMQDCAPQVLTYLQSMVTSSVQEEVVARAIVCLERWLQSGVTLSELYSDYTALWKRLLGALGSKVDTCFNAAVTTLCELVAAVDPLPGREPAVQAAISALLAQKWEYTAAVLEPTESNILHSQGLLTLVSVIASAESFLLAKGGNDAGVMLEWLVDGLGGGGGLGLEGATIAASSWPYLAAVPRSKRRDVLQAPFFGAAAQE